MSVERPISDPINLAVYDEVTITDAFNYPDVDGDFGSNSHSYSYSNGFPIAQCFLDSDALAVCELFSLRVAIRIGNAVSVIFSITVKL